MSHIDGAVNVINTLKPKDDLGFPIVEDTDVWGGIHVVPDVAARNAIDTRKLKLGMFCSVAGELKLYRLESLSPVTWVEFTGGGGGPTAQYATGRIEITVDGTILPDNATVVWYTSAVLGGTTFFSFTQTPGNPDPSYIFYDAGDTADSLAIKLRDAINNLTSTVFITATIDPLTPSAVLLTRTIAGNGYSTIINATAGGYFVVSGFLIDPYIVTTIDGMTGHVNLSAMYDGAGTAASAVSTHSNLKSGVHGISAFGATLVDDASASAARTTLGLGTAATSNTTAFEAAGAVSTHSALTSGIHGITAFGSSLMTASSQAAGRTALGLATIASSGSASDLAAGTVPAARMPAMTGEVTSSAGAVALTITASAVTNAKLANMAASTLKGNATGAPAAPTDLSVAAVKTLLAITAGDISGLATVATTGSASDLGAGTLPAARMPALTGDVTSTVNTVATTIANGAVSTAKMGGDVTAAGKALLDDADNAAQRSTLGLGTAATKNISSGTAAPSGGADGDIYLQYT